MISETTAARLLDFGSAGRIGRDAADEQLRGAVAIHNILESQGVAYLADEVGMGKTYVALGAIALFRHIRPDFRVLVIAPRENIQKKWIKELRNFTLNNVRFTDLRVRGPHGEPARSPVLCQSLLELVREASHGPDRDFFLRLTSFSLPLGKDAEAWRRKREDLGVLVPWAPRDALDLRSKETFKDNYARLVCTALPEFDLVVVDEGHNLKHGFGARVSARNRMLGLVFGHPEGGDSRFKGYGPRARRVLFLSATPVENDFRQLWNQLNVFHLGGPFDALASETATHEEKRAAATRFLVRRVTSMTVDGERMTKNLYRREWRNGGVAHHDLPLAVPDPRQRLIVALIQKNVAEILGHERLNNSFQIGMLASFESFFETAKVQPKNDEEASNFDGTDRDDPIEERLGVDVGTLNGISRSYRQRFDRVLPHPKMDALVEELARCFESGRKALVFVRRIASVKEIKAKLDEKYDEWVRSRLADLLGPELRQDLDRAFERYLKEKLDEKARRVTAARDAAESPDLDEDRDAIPRAAAVPDTGGFDTFFAWFFRGEGPPDLLSGAALRRRFDSPGSAYSTFFEENFVAGVLRVKPGRVMDALVAELGVPREAALKVLSRGALPYLPTEKRARRRRHLFLAFQRAALALLGERPGATGDRARMVLRERFPTDARVPLRGEGAPLLDEWLEVPTFWTELGDRPGLEVELLGLGEVDRVDPFASRKAFVERELRRELLSGVARLGHAFLDLYALAVRRVGSMRTRSRDDAEGGGERGLIHAYLDLVDAQRRERPEAFHAYRELAEVARNIDLILDCNAPDLRAGPLGEAGRLVGVLMGRQQPIGGMYGEINGTLVRQFRMPGYPLVLVTTDLLQEGEDLHTFCSEVHHYGISWMPSSMEQRIGRVDRVNSHTERRLRDAQGRPPGGALLQVYYPHLKDTYEVLQVERVLERMNRFLVLMHEGLGVPEAEDRRLDVSKEIVRIHRKLDPIRVPLETAYPIREEMLEGDTESAPAPSDSVDVVERFQHLRRDIQLPILWEERGADPVLLGTRDLGDRKQCFELHLRATAGSLVVRCRSPIGPAREGFDWERFSAEVEPMTGRVVSVDDSAADERDLWLEGDVLLAASAGGADRARVEHLVDRITREADRLEERLFRKDACEVEFHHLRAQSNTGKNGEVET